MLGSRFVADDNEQLHHSQSTQFSSSQGTLEDFEEDDILPSQIPSAHRGSPTMRRILPRHQQQRPPSPFRASLKADDADAAAGLLPTTSSTTTMATSTAQSPLRKRVGSSDSLHETEEPILVLGMDISHLSRRSQFFLCAAGVFGFSLLYGFLQELIAVKLCSRQLGLFLAMAQFIGYTLWSFLLRAYVYEKRQAMMYYNDEAPKPPNVPVYLYLGLSLLRAIDLGMTNLAMQYINYPAKTLMKSSRVVFTMLFGVLVARKRYKVSDYLAVLLMVSGLVIFMHADANSSAVFDPLGLVMLTISLICDGAISNMSEMIMNKYGVGQDEFIFRLYSIATIAITGAAIVKGDFYEGGMVFLAQPGTFDEIRANLPMNERKYSVLFKWAAMILFSTMGFFGSSCSAAITKNFGALVMSITSTARKATTLFLSFMIFDNEVTFQHVAGIVLFISSLVFKSVARGTKRSKKKLPRAVIAVDSELELAIESAPNSGNHFHPGYHAVV